jgi:subtilisin family serine protease
MLVVFCCATLAAASASMAAPVIDPHLLECRRVIALDATSQRADERAARARFAALEVENGRDWVDVWLMGSFDAEAIRRMGGEVRTVAGNVATARMPLDAVERLAQVPGLERVQMGQPMSFQSDLSVHEIGADLLWAGSPPNFPAQGLTGERVVVGIVDTGLDLTQADFRTLTGTRVAYLWDQNPGGTPPPPANLSYGSEYSRSMIDAGQCPSRDDLGHGTHVAGVAAGNGRATGNGVPAFTYVGASPEADLVVVKLFYAQDGTITDTKVIDGVRYVFDKAAALGLPAVVLVSAAKMTGPHDGQDPLDLGIAALTGPRKIVVAAAGNFGGASRHGEWTSTASAQTYDMTVTFGAYTPGSSGFDHLRSEAWYDAGTDYEVSIVTPSGQVVGPVARGGTSQVYTPQGIVSITNGQYTSATGAYRVDLFVYRGNTQNPAVASGTWKYRWTSRSSGSHRVDAWITSYMLGSVKPIFAAGKTEKRLVASPATANGVVSVGAYCTKDQWRAVDGLNYFYPLAALHNLAYFSSPGPRRDGQRVPSVTAPGYGVASSKSSTYGAPMNYVMPDGVHSIDYGTSAAAAHVAGVVALLLQRTPDMTSNDAIAALQQNVVADSYTGTIPNDSWGAGKLRFTAAAAIPAARAGTFGLALASANPTRGRMAFRFALEPGDLREHASVAFEVVDVTGRRVAALTPERVAGAQLMVWDGRVADGSRAPAGMYWAALLSGSRKATVRFVRLD